MLNRHYPVLTMSTDMSEKELYEQARKRVEEKKALFIHLVVYVVVNLFLITIWAVTGAGFPWFVFPLGGWGIGVLFHALSVFVFSKKSSWEQREIEREVERVYPPMLEQGGFIPHLDHSCPPNVSFEMFKYYIELSRRYIGV